MPCAFTEHPCRVTGTLYRSKSLTPCCSSSQEVPFAVAGRKEAIPYTVPCSLPLAAEPAGIDTRPIPTFPRRHFMQPTSFWNSSSQQRNQDRPERHAASHRPHPRGRGPTNAKARGADAPGSSLIGAIEDFYDRFGAAAVVHVVGGSGECGQPPWRTTLASQMQNALLRQMSGAERQAPPG